MSLSSGAVGAGLALPKMGASSGAPTPGWARPYGLAMTNLDRTLPLFGSGNGTSSDPA